MNKVKSSAVLTLLSVICYSLFVSCNNHFESPEIQTPADAYGRIRISFAGEEAAPQTARTVLPSTTFYQYTYTFTKTGEESGAVKAPGSDGLFSLEIGSYTAAVQAFTGNGETLAATGVSSEFSVGPGSNAPVEVVLTAVGTEAQGEFSYTITYPAGAAAEITLHKWPGLDTITLNPVNVTQGNGKTQTLQLATGSYLLTILAGKTGLYAGISEAIHIYPSLATAYTKNYVDNDFIPKIPGAAVGVPVLNNATQNSITINPVDPPANGQAVEYGVNTANTAPSAWQNGLTFSGLSGGVYYLFARSAENDDYAAGAASASLPVMIVTNTDQWNTALTAVRNGGSGTAGNVKSYTVMVFGNVAVSGSTATGASINFGSVQYIAVTLKGSGTLSLSSSGSILRLVSNQTLIIDDENMTLQGRSGNNNAVMYVQSGGTLELKNGAISGNTSSSSGGGVYLTGGTFTMSGGTISGNTSGSGGGVYVLSGSFTMSGGAISGNIADSLGGGVYLLSGSTFAMSGGIVYGSDAGSPLANTAASYGAALYSSGTARYGDASNILPHTDNYSSYTNNTIIPGVGGGSPVSDYDISGTGTFTYDGSAKTASVTRKENAPPGAITVLYNGTETLPVNVGTYTVTFNVAAATGFHAMTGLRAGTITITRASGAAVNAPTGTSSVTGTSITVNAVPVPSSGQTVEYARNSTNTVPSSGWQESTTFSNLTAGATYFIFARSKENTNYNTGAASSGYQVTTHSYGISLYPSGTHPFTAAAYGYGAQSARNVTVSNAGNQATGALTVALSGTNAGSFTLSTASINSIAAGGDASFTVVPITGLNASTAAYTATVTVSGANGISAALNVSFTVNKAAGASVNAPTGTSSVTGNSITVNAVTAPTNGQTVEYARNTSNSAPSSGWQESTTFSSLTAGATYYIFARSKENANYNAGTASASLQVTRVTVTFDANGGSGTVPSAQTVLPGSSITLPSESGLTRTDYTFGGWNTNMSGTGTNYDAGSSYPPADNITLYARWYSTVSFDANGATSGTAPDSQTANAGSSITLPGVGNLTRTNYTFGGWNTNASGTGTNYNAGSSYPPTGNITLYAKWNINRYTVTFNANSGTPAPAQQTIDHGGKVTEPAAMTRTGCTFGGWFKESSFTNQWNFATDIVTASTTLYARWNFVLPLVSVDLVVPYLATQIGGMSVDDPINLPMQVNLGDMYGSSDWMQLVNAIAAADKYVNLDLSVCTMTVSGSVFRPGMIIADGRDKIVGIALPNTAVSIYVSSNISNAAFRHFTNLKSFSGTGLTSIGDYAFYDCTSLALTALPAGVTSIGNYAFSGCTNLALTALPAGVTIGNYAFRNCRSLALTALPAGITSIGDGAFYGCTSLALTTLPSGITSIGHEAFSSCRSLALTSLPSGVTSIGSFAFSSCRSLALTDLPSGVTSISNGAFRDCTSLALVALPAGVTSIGDGAFRDCTSLALADLPSGVTSIGEYAFHGCTSLVLVICHAVTPPTLGRFVFYKDTLSLLFNLLIKVPMGSVEAYKSASGWSSYADRISGIE